MSRKRLVYPVDGQKHAISETVRTVLINKGMHVWGIAPDATVFEAIGEMAKRSIGALPVIMDGRLVGILSERDYARKVILAGRSSRETLVREIMTTSPITVTMDVTVDQCLRVMTMRHIRHLPVMDGDNVAGIISIGDLVKAIIATQAFTIDQLQTYIAAGYPV